MRIKIDRAALMKSLKRCVLPGTHGGNPVMSLIWLGARQKGEEPDSHDSLIMRATNSRVGVEQVVVCDAPGPGEVCINAARFSAAVAAMNGETLLIETDGNRLAVKAQGERRWSDVSQPADNFPPLPEPTGATWMKIRRDLIVEIFSKVMPNVKDVPQDRSERRGVYLETVGGGDILSVVLGDHVSTIHGVRDANVETKKGVEWQCLLPEPMLPLIQDVAADPKSPDDLQFYYDDNFVYCTTDATLICAARLRGEFPPYREMIKRADPKPVVTLPRTAALESLKALMAVRTDVARALDVSVFATGTPRMSLRYKTSDTNFADSLVLSEVPDQELKFSVNPDYFRQAIDSAGENPTLCWSEGNNLIVIKTDAGFTCLVCLVTQPEV